MLSEAEKQSYRENGYILLDNILTEAELDEISREYNAVFSRSQDKELEATWGGSWRDEALKDMKEFSVQSIHNLQYHSAAFTRLLVNPRLLAALRDVMNTDNILLHHTKAHIKPPGKGSPFPMHQDYHYFPFRDHSMVAVFVHLDDSDVSNGCLAVYPGSHKLGPLEDHSTAPGWHHVDQERFPIGGARALEARRGQVAIFSYLLVHGSYKNLSERVRRMLLIQLMAAEDEQLALMHVSPGQGLCLSGTNPRADADISRRHSSVAQEITDAKQAH